MRLFSESILVGEDDSKTLNELLTVSMKTSQKSPENTPIPTQI